MLVKPLEGLWKHHWRQKQLRVIQAMAGGKKLTKTAQENNTFKETHPSVGRHPCLQSQYK